MLSSQVSNHPIPATVVSHSLRLGEDAAAWLTLRLSMIEECEKKWSLEIESACSELSIDRTRTFIWSAVGALHSAFWSLRDDRETSRNWYAAMACAEELAKL
jgi:hypothetical protein